MVLYDNGITFADIFNPQEHLELALFLAQGEEFIEDYKNNIGLEEQIQDDVKTVDSTVDAVAHYYNGNGEAAQLGPETRAQLRRDEDYLRVLNKLKDGTAQSRTDKFDIHFTWDIFHIGDSNVNYSTSCADGECTTIFDAFVGDGFVDPLDMEDLLGAAFEPGGTPYNYIPYEFSITYPNPGYPNGVNIK